MAKNIYNYRWTLYRKKFLEANPYCIRCRAFGKLVKAVIVDHKIPHRGDESLFWDPENHQPLCKQHHDSYKQRLEKSGKVAGCDINGVPIDPNHHWNK